MIFVRLFHVLFFITILYSLICNDCEIKLMILLLTSFILLQYLSKHGKCTLISIEKYFLGEQFREGIVYRIIKPIISYKNNVFYNKLMFLHVSVILILLYQLISNNCFMIILNKFYIVYEELLK